MNGFMPSLENFSYSLIFPHAQPEDYLLIPQQINFVCVCVRQTKIIISMHKTLAVRVWDDEKCIHKIMWLDEVELNLLPSLISPSYSPNSQWFLLMLMT